MKRILLTGVFLLSVLGSFALAGEDTNEYKLADRAAKLKQYDFSYLHYRAISRKFPNSRYREKAIFVEGEYFFLMPEWKRSAEKFRQYVEEFPGTEGHLFALAHLYEIARSENQEDVAEELRKEIVTLKQVSLVFRDFEEYTFQSPLYRKYRAVFQIDVIEFYAQGELFAKISY